MAQVNSTADFIHSAGEIGAGHVLGRYELLMPIASGGMAMVWAARLKGSRGFQKIVAVKTMLPRLSEDEQFEQMFLDEASLASQIRHPHVVEIMDLGEEDGILYLVMEMVDGIPLNQLMKAAKRKGGIPLPISVRLVMQACAGLHAAHELKDRNGQLVGLVHRDVSPQNILVTYDGVTKVVDFGIAKATALGVGATQAGQIKGKVAYMAPEQVKGSTIDRRVDVFAIGIVLYALTTGKHPLRRESEAATMYNICSAEPVMPPSKIVPGYPSQLERVVMLALAKDPAKRYPTSNDMLRALDALPPTMRAGTDEDVGNFVKVLFAEKREERQAALQHALDLADLQSKERRAVTKVTTTVGTLTPVSSVSATGNTSVTASRVSIVAPGDIQASFAVGRTESAAREAVDFRTGTRRQGVVIGAAAALVLMGGGIALFGGGANAGGFSGTEAASQTHSASPVGAVSDEVVSKPVPSASASPVASDEKGVDPATLPTTSASASAQPAALPRWSAPPRPPRGEGLGSSATSPHHTEPDKPVDPPALDPKKPGWDKQNPGF